MQKAVALQGVQSLPGGGIQRIPAGEDRHQAAALQPAQQGVRQQNALHIRPLEVLQQQEDFFPPGHGGKQQQHAVLQAVVPLVQRAGPVSVGAGALRAEQGESLPQLCLEREGKHNLLLLQKFQHGEHDPVPGGQGEALL